MSPRRDRLHQHVADRRGFDRAGQHGAMAGIGRRLAELPILRAAADDVNRLDASADQSLEAS